MKHTHSIELRRFPVTVKNANGEISTDHIVIAKQELQAAQLVGQSSKELITRLYKRNGFEVVEIGKADKMTASVDLCALWERG